jgi:hypothetical protein
MYNEQFPRAYYFSFASTQRVRSGRFRDDLTILLPSEGRLFDGDSNLVVADSVEFVAINQTRRKLRLGSQGTYVQSLLFPQKDAQDLGFGGVEIDLREGNVHLKSSLRNLNDGAAKDEVAALDNKKDILDDALWDLTAAWHGKGRSSSQKGKFPPSRLPQPDKHPVAARSTFRVKVALADASKKAAALAEELGQTPFRGVPASLAVNADPAEQSKWLEEFATWYIEWGKHLGDLFNAYPKKRNELVASRARTNEKNGKSREGDQSEQALIGSVFVGDVFCVIEGTVNSTGKLQCGILIELVKYRDDQQSADPNASSDAKSQK